MGGPVTAHVHTARWAPHPEDARRRFWAVVSVLVGFVMLGGKWTAYVLTGSHAILSDALESVVHIAATLFAMFSLMVAARPPDARYPYGYGKIEYFSAGFEGGLIALAGLLIVWESVRGLIRPEPLRQLDLGLLLIGAASVINLALGLWLVRVGRQTRSLILEADGHHVLSDAYTSFGVLLGVALVRISGWWWLDPLIAITVGMNILRTGFGLVRRSYSGLMDRADRQLLETVVAALQARRREGWIDVHDLRAWRAGDRTFVDFHMVVPPEWTVGQLHEAHVEARQAIREALDGPVESIIHFDPDDRNRPIARHPVWTVESTTRTRHLPGSGTEAASTYPPELTP